MQVRRAPAAYELLAPFVEIMALRAADKFVGFVSSESIGATGHY
jgi:hypothetical protein